MVNYMQYASVSGRVVAKPSCKRDDAGYDGFLTKLADDVMQKYELPMLYQSVCQLFKEYGSFSKTDFLQILPVISKDETVGIKQRREAAKKDLLEYFSENESASLEGLIRFRMPLYHSILDETARCICHIYLVQKEYDEFIGLLKYFVSVQTERPQQIHLLVTDDAYRILDEEGRDITKQCTEELIPKNEYKYFCADDILLSILITTAPKEIIVHGEISETKSELFQTVEKVFERVKYCGGCKVCKK